MRLSPVWEYVLMGKEIRLRDWPLGQRVKMIKPVPPAGSKPGALPHRLPYLAMITPRQDFFPWTPGQMELFSVAWEVVDDG